MPAPPVAIIGMAGRFPGADDVGRFWQNLLSGAESITRTSAEGQDGTDFVRAVGRVEGIEDFDADYFRIPPAEAVLIDPQHRVLLEVAAAAMQDAGYEAVRDQRVGVYVGCGENYYLPDFVEPREAAEGRGGDPLVPSAGGTDTRVLSANEKDFLAARIAFKLGLQGPSITVQATCASGLTAVALACSALAVGDCDIAIAGGVGLIMPDMQGYRWSAGGIFAADGRCRAFDAEASGTVPGSGAAVVVLRRDEDARAVRDRRRVVIRGWAVNNDGGSRAGFTAPSAAGQHSVIMAALHRAGLDPDQVGYVETHGTGTPIGDAVELTALGRVFGTGTRAPASLVLGAVKPNIGHADAAAGVIGLIKAAASIENGVVPPTLHFRTANPDLRLEGSPFRVSPEPVSWPAATPRIAGVSAFGLGGNNAHVVIEAVEPVTPAATDRTHQVVTLSARAEGELLRQRSRLADWLEQQPPLPVEALADVAFTLAVGRPVFEYRWSASVTNSAELIAALRAPELSANPVQRWSARIDGPVAAHAAAGRSRAASEPLVRAALLELAGSTELDARSDPATAALTSLANVHVLERLGLGFSRVDVPTWLQPALDWYRAGADQALLEAALESCQPSAEAGAAGTAAGCVRIGPDFELSAALAHAWARGARIDWQSYYRAEDRGRVQLPTYPFNRQRHWLKRVPRGTVTAAKPLPTIGGDDIVASVAAVWRSVLGLDEIDHDAHFLDELGGDSMYAVEIGARLAELFHVKLPIDLPFIAPTVTSAAKLIQESLEPAGPTTRAIRA
ncbi:MAG: beta-ketoacyl synthase N-terminal-like domain-containing protein [Jatrophihabitantaceae bacterium]